MGTAGADTGAHPVIRRPVQRSLPKCANRHTPAGNPFQRAYEYLHLFLFTGLGVAGAGAELLVEHAEDEAVESAVRWALSGGIAGPRRPPERSQEEAIR